MGNEDRRINKETATTTETAKEDKRHKYQTE